MRSCREQCTPSLAAEPTLDQLHDDVDGLLLGAHPDQPHDVGMLVLLQDPGTQTSLQRSAPVCVFVLDECDGVCRTGEGEAVCCGAEG